MDRAYVEGEIQKAGPGGRLHVTYREYLTPQFDPDTGAPITDGLGNVVHAHDPAGHIRTVSAFPVRVLDGMLAIGHGPAGPITSLIAFDEIDKLRADPVEGEAPGALTPAVVEEPDGSTPETEEAPA